MDAVDNGVVAATMGALREATSEGAERRRVLCTPRLLGALRHVLLLPWGRRGQGAMGAWAQGSRARLERSGPEAAAAGVVLSAERSPRRVRQRRRDFGS